MNRYFTALTVSGTLLALAILTAIKKVIPTTLSSLVDHCQSLTASFSFHFPHVLLTLIFLGVFIVTGATFIRLLITIIRTEGLKKWLSKNAPTDAKLTRLIDKLYLTDKVYLSSALVNITNGDELEAVLRHEKYHLEHKDSITLLAATLAESLFPFFPLFSDLVRNFRVEKEIKADIEAIDGLNNKGPLISILRKLLKVEPQVLAFAPGIVHPGEIESRIMAMMGENNKFTRYRLSSILVSLVSLIILSGIIFL